MKTINEAGALACVNDKWDESEPDKGHKLVDYAGRCVDIPDDLAAPKSTADCVGKYEYMPHKSCSHLKEYTYKYTGGTGRYEGASGGGTYTLEELTDTLMGGKYKGTKELP
jgi:hypothetical protein